MHDVPGRRAERAAAVRVLPASRSRSDGAALHAPQAASQLQRTSRAGLQDSPPGRENHAYVAVSVSEHKPQERPHLPALRCCAVIAQAFHSAVGF